MRSFLFLQLDFNMENKTLQGLRMNAAVLATPAECVLPSGIPSFLNTFIQEKSTVLDLNNNFSVPSAAATSAQRLFFPF